ncbi:MAG: DUF4384 domain-containing protein [Pseudomonadota bacterium]
MLHKLKVATLSGLLALAGCATPSPSDVSATARPDSPPVPTVTRFEEPLSCMDNAFAEFGVSGVTIAVSAVPDYTGRVFVGSDIWLQGAIAKMSQRSGAFVVTDYNPNQLAPEQGLWVLSPKDGFYIPAYYIRGAISGFAGNVTENSGTVGIGTPMDGASLSSGSAYSLVSVDLTVGNLQQRTIISRARAANEVALRSRASGAQLGGMLEKYGANLEIIASRSDGVPHAVRALIELNSIEALGRLTGVPYWSCLGLSHDDREAQTIRQDIFLSMSEPERVVFTQRRLASLGLYSGPLNGERNLQLQSAVDAFLDSKGRPKGTSGLDLFNVLTDWRDTGSAPDRLADNVAVRLAPQTASQPVPGRMDDLAEGFSVQINMVANQRTPGAPLSFSLRSSQTAYAYCYLQDVSGSVARVFPNRWQPDPLVPADEGVTVPGVGAGFDLVFPPSGAREQVVCFVSSLELGAGLPNRLKAEDLAPLPVPSLQALRDQYVSHARENRGQLVIRELDLSAR